MAFVYRAEKITQLSPTREEFDVGPGQYLPQTQILPSKPHKVPFMTATNRSELIGNFDNLDVPGPGAYYHDETFEKIYKNIKRDKFIKAEKAIDLKALEQIHCMTAADGFPAMVLKKNAEALGFLGKDVRFKEKNEEKTPGPGHYIKPKENRNFQASTQTNFRKGKVEKIESMNKIVSIPNKNQAYGYEVEDELNAFLNEDPEKSKKFKGEKNDTVGPGNYNVDQPDVWLKKGGTQWSKSKTKKTLFGQTHANFKSHSPDNLINPKLSKSFEVNINELQKNMKIYPERSTSARVRKIESKNVLKCNNIRKRNRIELIMTLNDNNKPVDMYGAVQNKLAKGNPGPGYYYDDRMSSAFKSVKYPEFKQNFQSNLQRFPQNKNQEVGPGTYFHDKDDVRFMEKKKGKIYPITTIPKGQFEKTVEIVPGPGQYDSASSFASNKRNLSHYNFGSTEKRFVDMAKTNKTVTPGPGSYLDSMSTFYITKDKWVNVNVTAKKEKTKDPANMIKRALTTKTIRQAIDNSSLPKSLYEKQTETKNTVPSVGTYNPDTIFSIDYKIKKNSHKFGLVDAAFNSTLPKNRVESKKDENNLGPGFYYKDKKPSTAQIYPPFNSHQQRTTIDVKNDPWINTGPGLYNQSSYFDWNKKTHNILYL
jgi:hypothetical protein